MRISSAYCFCFICVLLSCTSPKEIIYFQELNKSRIDSLHNLNGHIIKPYDYVQISVTSMNSQADLPFEKSSLKQENTVSGYVVDSIGRIDLPYLGSITIAGLSTSGAKDLLKQKLEPFLKTPSINIRILNYRVSVLGEVSRPGTFSIPTEKVSLPEAISLAGDLTINGRRDNVLIIRESQGIRKYERINLKGTELFSSPYYYLQSNDIVYVEPARGKIAETDMRKWQFLTLMTTLLSLGIVIVTQVK